MDMVNGFRCKDCTDIDLAKKHIDPAHPKDGPYGVLKAAREASADGNAGLKAARAAVLNRAPAIQFSGLLANAAANQTATSPPYAPGANVDLSA